MNKNNEYEIDRELTGKFAIEKNAEYQDRIAELEEENKKLQIEIGGIMGERDGKQMRIDELEEENKNLKSDLEQFSEAYKRYRDFEKEELADSCYDLEKENKKLKEELSKYKKQYQHSMGFSDFGGYDE